MRYCLDVLAGAKYPKIVRAIPNHFGIGAFATTFGDFYPIAEKELHAGRDFIRIHLLWSDGHSFSDSDLLRVCVLAAKYESLAKVYPEAVIQLSPFCEHRISRPDKYLDATREAAPSCVIVNTPEKGGLSKKYPNEVHGERSLPKGYGGNYSFDGTDCLHDNVAKRKAANPKAEAFFLWTSRFNLKETVNDPTPRPKRKAKPSRDLIKAVCALV